jgi:hypothetical protein
MSSLFTDTIRKTGGTAGTDIKINNSSTYVDGSNKSTNMVAALTKGWINMSYGGSAARSDSLNNSSLTDNGTGDFTFTHTNNFNYDGYCTHGLGGGHANSDGHWDYQIGNNNQATSSSQVRAYNTTAAAYRDATGVSILWTGDLA